MISPKRISFNIVIFLACIPLFAQDLYFEEKNGVLSLYESNSPLFSYQKETRSENGQYPRANYIHPLYGINGEIITEDFPEDHLHHRGIFWTWHQLFVQGKRVADPWLCEGIRWKVDSTVTKTDKNSASLKAVVYWLTGKAKDKAVIREDVLISYIRKKGFYEMDFDITLTALVNGVELGGSEDVKEYGGFSARIKTLDRITFLSENGEVVPENTPVDAGGWIHIIPDYNPGQKGQTGIVLMSDPGELPSFQGWILRKNQSMQNAAFPGRKPISIPKDKPLKFRNRLVVHSGALKKVEIEELYRNFVKSR